MPRCFDLVADAIGFAPPAAVFDVAVPTSQLVHILPHLLDGDAMLIQEPMSTRWT